MTSGTGDEPVPDAGSGPLPRSSSFARIVGVFWSPVETLRDIARRPDWAVPLLVILILSAAGAAVMSTKLDIVTTVREQMEQRHASDAEIARAVPMASAIAKMAMYVSPLLNVLLLVVIAFALMTAMRMFGGDAEFRPSFSATVYSWMPMALNGILVVIVALTRTSFTGTEAATLVRSNLAFLVEGPEHPMLFSLLTSLDVFKIWTAVLLTIGFAEVSRLSRAAAGAIVGTLWGLVILVSVGFAALQGMMGGHA